MPRSGDTHFPFRQDADLFALTGIDQPGTILVLYSSATQARHRVMTFMLPDDPLHVIWNGKRYSTRDARKISGIASIYSSDRQVVAMATGLLLWLGVYHLGDATQALCIFVLRCYRVAVAPLVAYCVLLWGVGVVGGYQLAYGGLGPWVAQRSPAAFWIASSFALALLAIILPLILWRAVRTYRPA